MHTGWSIVREPLGAVFGVMLVAAAAVLLLNGGDVGKSGQTLAMVADTLGNVFGLVIYSLDDLVGGIGEASNAAASQN